MRGLILLCVVLLMNSCATTSLSSVWTTDSLKRHPFVSVLVVGVIEPQELKVYFEAEFVRRLQRKGVNAVAEHTLTPKDEDNVTLEEKEIKSRVQKLGMDTVLMARLLSVDDLVGYETYPVEVSAGNLYGYYVFCCQNIVQIGRMVKFETKVFEAKNGELIWSALSETALNRNREISAESFIAAVIDDLSARGYLQINP
ncbi:MAG: hypothetical protein L6290_08385 [Thermodesulfovibrionales bacterium]|nr:hypothetical protein [Thermodesulfovibrionales bacterium]